LGFGGGCMHESGSFPFDSPPKSVRNGAQFWGFWCSRVRGVLGGISLIPLEDHVWFDDRWMVASLCDE
jgi:hypothetical protein